MNINTSCDIIQYAAHSLFLAGPTPRDATISSWRPAALEFLQQKNFQGLVYVPEPFAPDYNQQVNWETEALTAASVILFWIPRELNTMPGYTTNVEFGIWLNSGKVVLGVPPGAPKTRYLQYHATRCGVPQADTLEKTIDLAIGRIYNGTP